MSLTLLGAKKRAVHSAGRPKNIGGSGHDWVRGGVRHRGSFVPTVLPIVERPDKRIHEETIIRSACWWPVNNIDDLVLSCCFDESGPWCCKKGCGFHPGNYGRSWYLGNWHNLRYPKHGPAFETFRQASRPVGSRNECDRRCLDDVRNRARRCYSADWVACRMVSSSQAVGDN